MEGLTGAFSFCFVVIRRAQLKSASMRRDLAFVQRDVPCSVQSASALCQPASPAIVGLRRPRGRPSNTPTAACRAAADSCAPPGLRRSRQEPCGHLNPNYKLMLLSFAHFLIVRMMYST